MTKDSRGTLPIYNWSNSTKTQFCCWGRYHRPRHKLIRFIKVNKFNINHFILLWSASSERDLKSIPQANHSILVSIWKRVINSLYQKLLYLIPHSKTAYWKPFILLIWITTVIQTIMFFHFCISLISLWSTWSLLQAKETSEKCFNCLHITVKTNQRIQMTFKSILHFVDV